MEEKGIVIILGVLFIILAILAIRLIIRYQKDYDVPLEIASGKVIGIGGKPFNGVQLDNKKYYMIHEDGGPSPILSEGELVVFIGKEITLKLYKYQNWCYVSDRHKIWKIVTIK